MCQTVVPAILGRCDLLAAKCKRRFALGLLLLLSLTPAVHGTGPNVVILFADDLGYGDLGSYGHPYIRTPHLDDLAANGQRWTDFYTAASVCSPSRAALLTGRLPVRTGLYGNRIRVMFPDDPNGIPAAETTVAEALQAQGYATGIFGKWHLGDAPHAYPTRHGFNVWYGVPYSNDMRWEGEQTFEEALSLSLAGRGAELQATYAQRRWKLLAPKIEYWNVPLIRSEQRADGFDDEVIEEPADQRTLTKRYTEEAIAFIRNHGNQPFFVYLPYTMPHVPLFRSDEFTDTSLGGRYGDVIEEIDWSVGQIVAALKRLDLTNDTLVVFTSDNGPWLIFAQHGGSAGLLRMGKGTTFEGGLRVPAIFSWPETIPPSIVSELGSTLDIYPTVLALSGQRPAQTLDGVDLSATLTRQARSPRNEMPFYRNGDLYAYRVGEFKLHLITFGAYNQPPPRTEHAQPLLYHLPTDPGERTDVAGEHPDVVEHISNAINRHLKSFEPEAPIFDQRVTRLLGSP
jgi:arylsulfatase A